MKLYIFLDLEGVFSNATTHADIIKAWEGRENMDYTEDDYIKHNLNDDNPTIIFGAGDSNYGETLSREIVKAFRSQLIKFKDMGYDVNIVLTSSATGNILSKKGRNQKMIDHYSEVFGGPIIGGSTCGGSITYRFQYMLDWLTTEHIDKCAFPESFKAVIIDDIDDANSLIAQSRQYVSGGCLGFLHVNNRADNQYNIRMLTTYLEKMVESGNVINEQNVYYLQRRYG